MRRQERERENRKRCNMEMIMGLSCTGDPRPQSSMLFVCLVEPEFTSTSNLLTAFTQIHVCNLGSASPEQPPRHHSRR
ncbi:hypothetical protein EYF80_050539 [Liparis tanakae]|uniref:Uncharacterized protein n=1 Tax=Liparis tanakae TaxID=230148 RepID=A0A4Z2FEH8_9TELE|nr:hypothetical protein EYF80_050539 [Liparis tanakae]